MTRFAATALAAFAVLVLAAPASGRLEEPRRTQGKAQAAKQVERAAVRKVLRRGSFEGSLTGWAGYRATLSLVAGQVGQAARVTRTGGSDYSIVSTPRPVLSTLAGTSYAATGVVRSPRGKTVCLRVREWSGSTVVGSQQVCVAAGTAWKAFPSLVYTAKGAGRQLDVYAFQTGAVDGDLFDVDELRFGLPGTAPAPAPAPAPSALEATVVDHAHVRLDWPAVAGATAYRVVREGVHLGTVAGTSFTDALLWPSTAYAYTVEAQGTSTTWQAGATTRALPAAGFPRPFATDSFWNTRIGASPRLHPNSSAMAAYLAANARNPNMPLADWAVSVAEARPTDPLFTVPCTRYACTLSAFGAFRIPVTAKADPSGDGHLVVYDPATDREWGMWQAVSSGGSWSASAGAAVSISGDGVAPARTASGNAANFPMLGGLIRPEEILQGRIDHALVFGMPGVGAGAPVCPATHNAGSSTNPAALREGQKVQLDPSLNVDALSVPAWQKTVLRAMQEYGMYLRDGSGSLAVYAENPISRGYDAWAKVGLGGRGAVALAGIPWERFRVLDAPDC